MNYYEHWLGDYLRDAGHLSMLEDGAYRRLLDQYYIREQPLPADKKAVHKLVRATTAAERKAVDYVLGEFFDLREDGYHQKRVDEEIERYTQRAQTARENGKRGGRPKNRVETQPVNSGIPSGNPTHNPGKSSPVPNPQSPIPDLSLSQDTHSGATTAGAVCVTTRSLGMMDGNPSHPKLLALIEAGATIGEFEGAAKAAIAKGKGFAYTLAIVENQRRDAARIASMPATPEPERRWEPPDEEPERAQG